MPTTLAQRIANLERLLARVGPVPPEWLEGAKEEVAKKHGSSEPMKPLPCTSYKELLNAWKRALHWRQEMEDVLSVMLACALSIEQVGDQLFFQIIGDAGGGKSRFCDALLTSSHCAPVEGVTGFLSGYKNDKEGTEDFSFLARNNRKLWITSEGDLLMKSPRFHELMSQQRRIFDGSTAATYKNNKKDRRYTGLRTPWIIAGTPAMLSHDQSQLGDRFLRLFLDSPDDMEKRAILQTVGHTALRSVMKKSNGIPESQLEEFIGRAYRMTGGYVDYLLLDPESLLNRLTIDAESLVNKCAALGEFTAKLRARPNAIKKEIESTDEMPTRLTHQFVRLSCCLAAVMEEPTVTPEVIRRVTKVALDTSRGQCLEIVRYLLSQKEPKEAGAIANHTQREDWGIGKMLGFLKRIHVVEDVEDQHKRAYGLRKWKVTQKMKRLYEGVLADA